MIHKLLRPNIVFKLLLFLLLASVIPLLVLGIASYNTSQSVIRADVSNYTLALMVEQKNYLDLVLEQVEGLVTNISSVEDIKESIDDEGSYDPTDDFTRLATHAEIGYILNSYVSLKGLVSIDIFTPGGAHYHVGDTLDVGEINRVVLERIYAEVLASDKLVLWTGVEDNVNANSTHHKVITAAKLFRKVDVESLQEKPGAVLLVNYSVDSLYDHYSQLEVGPGSYMLIVDTKNRLIFHPDTQLIGAQISPTFVAQLGADKGSFVTEVDGQEMFVTYSQSDVSDWYLISLVPLKNLSASANVIRNTMLWVLVISFGFIALVAVWMSKTLVEPIKRITELFKQIQAGTFNWQMRFKESRTDEIGELFEWFNVFLDSLEARRQAERELIRARDAAEAANKAKSTFLANMSHELRTPLNAILGFADLLARSPALPVEQRANVSIITTSGEHLLTLINQVLDLSKIEAGQMSLAEKDVDLFRLLDDLEGMFQLRAAEKGLRLVFDRMPDTPRYIQIDEIKLRQVLINLLSNGLKFSQQGWVSLRVSPGSEQTPTGSAQMSPDRVTLHFEIEDTGPGIAPNEMANLFKAFTQLKAGQQVHEGTGLGLAISQKFVQLMGGEIAVTTVVGQGTIFQLDVPVKVSEEIERERRFGSARRVVGLEPGQPVYRLLVVDDNRDNRQLLIALLQPLGFELRQAENGREAINIWAEWQPHLIWMDIRMPVMDGREATQRIKATPQGQLTFIVALTASAFEENRAEVLALGCDDFIRKPFTEPEIIEMLSRHLGLKFVYDDAEVTGSFSGDVQRFDRQDLAAAMRVLPAELLTGLEQAAICIDLEMMDRYIQDIQPLDGDLAQLLAALADDFKYDEIINLIQKTEETKNG